MLNGKYSLRYIPRYEEDINEIVDYIVFKLNYLLNHFSQIEKGRLPIIEFMQIIFTIYYVVIDDVMEVRRVLYKGRDMDKIIKQNHVRRRNQGKTGTGVDFSDRRGRSLCRPA